MADPQRYLTEVQYRHPDRLAARALLHTKYGRGDWFEWLTRAIPLPAGALIADVGCGAGAFWVNAPAAVPDDLRLRLFDLSPGMVASADRAIRALGRWRDVEVAVADAAALPLPDGAADTVMAIHMLYHLAEPDAGIRELARTVADEGVVAVVLNPSGTMGALSRLVDDALARDPVARREPLTSEQALPLLKRRFGTVERLRFDDELVVTDPIDLLAYLLSLPAADAEGAAGRLAVAVERAFDHGAVEIAKAADLLLCRR